MNLKVSKADLYYEVIGQGIPVLLIHGFSLDMHVMKGAYEPLFTKLRGFKRVYVDLPAMGKSVESNDMRSSEDMMICLREFIETIFADEKFIVIGQSFGGYLAQEIIAEMPEKTLGLGLLCPVVVTDSEKRILPKHKLMVDDSKNINYDDKEDFEEFVEYAVVANQYTYDRYKTDTLVGYEHAKFEVLQVIREEHYGLTPEPFEKIKAYDQSSLILVGKQDAGVGYQDVLKLDATLNNVTIAMVNKAGHSLQYDQVDVFNSLTLDWLKGFM